MTARAIRARLTRVTKIRFRTQRSHSPLVRMSWALAACLASASVPPGVSLASETSKTGNSGPHGVEAPESTPKSAPESASQSPSEHERTKLPIGMSTALSGPAAELGPNMRDGVLLAFEEANATRGLPEHWLELIAIDDGYEPVRTAPNMHHLIAEQEVLAVVGNVGTPTAITAIPIAQRAETPFFGAFTGANALRDKTSNTYVINFRASYAQETAALVEVLISQGIEPEEICFFTQNDAFGDDGFFGGLEAIRRHKEVKQSEIAHARYRRNTLQVEGGLADLLLCQPPPKAVILVGTYAPCAKLIRLARDNGFQGKFCAVSFVGSEALMRSLGEYANGIVVTEVVPHVTSNLPIVQQYRAAIKRYAPTLTLASASLEGYIVGRILIKAIASIQGQVTRPAIKEALEQLGEFDIGLDIPLTLGPHDHQASSQVWPMLLSADGSLPIDRKELPSE